MEKKILQALAVLLVLTVTLTSQHYWQSATANPATQYQYFALGMGRVDSAGFLAGATWTKEGWKTPEGGVPFATRAPYITPMAMSQNITFSDADPTTGVVTLTVPKASYKGLNHTFYSTQLSTYYNVQLIWSSTDDGIGWLFTGTGIDPIFGDVNIRTFGNNTGTYFYGPDGLPSTADDKFISSPTVPPPSGLVGLTGGDGVPGTGDAGDYFGDGLPDPVGSSIVYLPTTLYVQYWTGTAWAPLFLAPWPQILTTATAGNTVIQAGSQINGVSNTETGRPWQWMSTGGKLWPDLKSNVFVRYVCAYSELQVGTAVGFLDVHFIVDEYLMREDFSARQLTDINSDQKVDIKDIAAAAKAFGSKDEGFGTPVATPTFDARADINADSKIDIKDIAKIAKDFGKTFTPADP